MTTFLDVGGHEGQTLQEVTKERWAFDHIHCFEPMPTQADQLQKDWADDPRVTIHSHGLSDHTGAVPMYGTNEGSEASIYLNKNDVNPDVVTTVQMVSASEWISDRCPDDTLLLKLNCEGSEVPILDDLISSGLIWRIQDVMIDWDIRKVPGEEHHEQRILADMEAIGFTRFSLCDKVMRGATHQERIANWLRGVR
jgi:FkbM family methyltransferase